MVCVLVSSAVERGFESQWGQTKDYEIYICCFSAKHTALRRKSKDRFAQNQDKLISMMTGMCLSFLLCHIAFVTPSIRQLFKFSLEDGLMPRKVSKDIFVCVFIQCLLYVHFNPIVYFVKKRFHDPDRGNRM